MPSHIALDLFKLSWLCVAPPCRIADHGSSLVHERKTSEAGLTELHAALAALSPPLATGRTSKKPSSSEAGFVVVDDFVTLALRTTAAEVKVSTLCVFALEGSH